MTACVYTACRQEGLPRTIKELSSALSTDSKCVGRIYQKLSTSLGLNTSGMRVLPGNLAPRMCSQLRLSKIVPEVMAICDVIVKGGMLDGTTPSVSAAAAVYYICKKRNLDVDIYQICAAVSCNQSFVLNAYEKLLPCSEALDSAATAVSGDEAVVSTS